MARLTILTPQEIDTLYSIPSLDDEERSFLFSLDEVDRAILDALGNVTARKVDYLLQLGFYRGKRHPNFATIELRHLDLLCNSINIIVRIYWKM